MKSNHSEFYCFMKLVVYFLSKGEDVLATFLSFMIKKLEQLYNRRFVCLSPISYKIKEKALVVSW